jgi:hypothetical protein
MLAITFQKLATFGMFGLKREPLSKNAIFDSKRAKNGVYTEGSCFSTQHFEVVLMQPIIQNFQIFFRCFDTNNRFGTDALHPFRFAFDDA